MDPVQNTNQPSMNQPPAQPVPQPPQMPSVSQTPPPPSPVVPTASSAPVTSPPPPPSFTSEQVPSSQPATPPPSHGSKKLMVVFSGFIIVVGIIAVVIFLMTRPAPVSQEEVEPLNTQTVVTPTTTVIQDAQELESIEVASVEAELQSIEQELSNL